MNVKGTFEVTMSGEPPYSDLAGVTLGRASLSKVFSGPLSATSQVSMLASRTPIASSAGYVALERIEGTLEGKSGSFVVVHLGLMNRGEGTLTIRVVPDSGTGELQGIEGSMDVVIASGVHHYVLDYSLPA